MDGRIETGANGGIDAQVSNRREFCKGCNICVLVCPSHVFEEGEEMNERGYIPPRTAYPEKCPNHRRASRKEAVCEMRILTCPDHALSWDEKERGDNHRRVRRKESGATWDDSLTHSHNDD